MIIIPPDWLAYGRWVAQQRQANADQHGVRHRWKADPADGLWMHTDGAFSQIAFLLMTGWPREAWTPFVPTSDPSALPGGVGGWGVRSTRHLQGHLPLHRTDNPRRPFVLMLRFSDEQWECAGCCWAWQGQLPQLWGEFPGQPGRPVFKVPQAMLYPWGPA